MTEQTTAQDASEARPKVYHLVVNGQQKVVASRTVTFEEIVELAFPNKAHDPDLTFVVTYRNADKPHEGSLAEGGEVEIKEKGTIFNVTFTNKS